MTVATPHHVRWIKRGKFKMGFTSDLPTYQTFSTHGPEKRISGSSFEPRPDPRFNRKLTVRATAEGTEALSYSPALHHRKWRHEFFHAFLFHALHEKGVRLNGDSMLSNLAEGLIQAALVRTDRAKEQFPDRRKIEQSFDSLGADFIDISFYLQGAYPNRKKLEQTLVKMLESPTLFKSIKWLNSRPWYRARQEPSLTKWHYLKIIDYLLRNAPQN